MIFEFQDTIIVVEVTFTSSSRQEAAEGEPVRRHVAKYAEEQSNGGKAVFGLFLAVSIDSNTAHTFRMGDWYLKNDEKINLDIVPINLVDFIRLFEFGSDRLSSMPDLIENFLLRARAVANRDAPLWKQAISDLVSKIVFQ